MHFPESNFVATLKNIDLMYIEYLETRGVQTAIGMGSRQQRLSYINMRFPFLWKYYSS